MATRGTMVIGDTSLATSREMTAAFGDQGIQVLATCQDGIALVEAVLEHKPDVVALDLVLPKLTGLQAIATLKRKGANPTFVVASAVSARERVMAAKEAGASYYILKPLDSSALGGLAARVVDRFLTAVG
ncbi:MAG: response regulator [Deferrisomatales bacterium]|nr:response regulator [Deferrisomatales bacterium]